MILARQDNKHGFEKGHHGHLSAHGMALAANLSARRHGFMLDRAVAGEDGQTRHVPYGRFPVTRFLLIKGAMILGGEDNLAMRIHLARQLRNRPKSSARLGRREEKNLPAD